MVSTTLPVSHQSLICFTQDNGLVHIDDLRCKSPVQSYQLLDPTFGRITCFKQAFNPYQLLASSNQGQILIFDLRYNIPMPILKNTKTVSISDLTPLSPSKLLLSLSSPHNSICLIDLLSGKILKHISS